MDSTIKLQRLEGEYGRWLDRDTSQELRTLKSRNDTEIDLLYLNFFLYPNEQSGRRISFSKVIAIPLLGVRVWNTSTKNLIVKRSRDGLPCWV